MALESRIVGHGEVAPAELVPNPRNWRVHPQAQVDALGAILGDVGWVTDVIVNRRTGYLVDGHARVAVAVQRGEASVPVVYVDLSEEEEQKVLATLDPLAAMAEADHGALEDLLATVTTEDPALAAMLEALSEESAPRPELDPYTQKVTSPIYEPVAERPAVAALYDASRAQELAAEIGAADIPDDLRAFLEVAAQRHAVLNFARIADYYAHADPDVQRLMEASALVIIDSDQAIERGFFRLHEGAIDAFEDEYPGA
jgi:ParB-like chromosome segregation protein Spo0J